MIRVPKQFFPKFNCELIRLGNDSDWGYVISKKSVENSKLLISFGLSNDWSFDEAYTNITNQKIYCYDLSVNNFFLLEIISRFLLPYYGKFATVVPVLCPVARAATLVYPP